MAKAAPKIREEANKGKTKHYVMSSRAPRSRKAAISSPHSKTRAKIVREELKRTGTIRSVTKRIDCLLKPGNLRMSGSAIKCGLKCQDACTCPLSFLGSCLCVHPSAFRNKHGRSYL